jgi:hypothetical protein
MLLQNEGEILRLDLSSVASEINACLGQVPATPPLLAFGPA